VHKSTELHYIESMKPSWLLGNKHSNEKKLHANNSRLILTKVDAKKLPNDKCAELSEIVISTMVRFSGRQIAQRCLDIFRQRRWCDCFKAAWQSAAILSAKGFETSEVGVTKVFHEKDVEMRLVLRFSNTAALFSRQTRRTILN